MNALGLALVSNLNFASPAFAQSAEGSIFGQATSGESVVIVNTETGVSRSATVGKDGSFQFSKLPPGRYKVTSANVTREVNVSLGTLCTNPSNPWYRAQA